ncbi:MAG: TonB-dependent receptor, partial [Dokdonia donghaensis]|nr:TonB-dependent receptor [Dokdonia donghaensis]
MFFSISSIIAQNIRIQGVVNTSQNSPIAFANVVLLDEEQKLVKGTITEEDGSFILENLKTGTYHLTVSFVGFDDQKIESILLEKDTTLRPIVLNASQESLDEVVLTSKKPTVVRKADRLVFNVENTILSSGNTMDILKRTPGVVVNQEEITIRNEGVTVYLNDKRVQLSAEEIQDLLSSLSGDAIQSVEVIANPPARYEAEGGPVLNIIT